MSHGRAFLRVRVCDLSLLLHVLACYFYHPKYYANMDSSIGKFHISDGASSRTNIA